MIMSTCNQHISLQTVWTLYRIPCVFEHLSHFALNTVITVRLLRFIYFLVHEHPSPYFEDPFPPMPYIVP